MTCSSCKNLNEKKKIEGKVSGCKYVCSKLKAPVYGSDTACSKYTKATSRSNDTCNKIYREGLNFDDDTHSASFYLIIGAILLVLTIIVFLCNPSLFGK